MRKGVTAPVLSLEGKELQAGTAVRLVQSSRFKVRDRPSVNFS
jgi:hypothetical protein